MSKEDKLPSRSSRADVDKFLQTVARTPPAKVGDRRGRLIMALDATASRQPTWDQACHIQAEMFRTAASVGGIEIQLCFYRGQAEFSASSWYAVPEDLLRRMSSVFCLGGLTQIGRVLRHAATEARRSRVNALVFVGDSIEESIDVLSRHAGQLGLLGVPVFIFHEGGDPVAGKAFAQIARISGGACCPFDATSAEQLRELLTAVAVYVAGGRKALTDFSRGRKGPVALLAGQLKTDD